jgi:hypothetical protein
VTRLALVPRPADPVHWNLLYETPDAIVSGKAALERRELPGGGRRPPVSRSTSTILECGVRWRHPRARWRRRFCRYLFADIEEHPGDGADVSFRDARFVVRGRREFSVVTVRVDPP